MDVPPPLAKSWLCVWCYPHSIRIRSVLTSWLWLNL